MEARIHTPWNVCVDLQMVSVDEATALELIPALQSREEKTVCAAWDRLQAMLKTREATLLAWPMVRTVDGTSGVSETVLEKRYATEFEPPREPGDRGIKKPGSVNAATADGLPLAFETRNLGVVLEVEPLVLDGGKRICLHLEPLRTELLKMEEDRHVLTTQNTLVTVRPPLLATHKASLELTVPNGVRQLVAVHRLAKPGNLVELQILRAVASRAD